MDREKLLEEYKVTLESLVEKTKFVYSEEFYKLDDFDKQKYQKDKMATETHLSTLSNLLWGGKFQVNGGLSDMFALGIIGSLFGGGCFNTMPPMPKLDDKDIEKENGEQKVYVIPEK